MGLLKKLTIVIPVMAICLYFLRQYTRGGQCKSNAKLTGKVAIITGANTGIGKMNALDHVQRGATVIMACRSLERGNKAAEDILNITGAAKSQVDVMHLNLASLASVRKFVEEFKKKYDRLDILTNNAGVMWVPYSKTEDGFEMTMGVNHLGHFLLTNLLLEVLKRSAPSRIINVSSRAYMRAVLDLDDLMSEKGYNERTAYSNSKFANVLFTRELAKRLKGTGVTAYSLHPGVVSTELARHAAWIEDYRSFWEAIGYFVLKNSHEGAQTQICCAVDPALAAESGKYYSDCAVQELLPFALDSGMATQLWDMSVKLVGLKTEDMS